MEPHKEPAEHVQNNYVDLVSESHGGIPQQTIFHVAHTESQKKRRRFIPFKFHSKIFKASKKKRHADDHRISTNSSSYASCRTFKKDSGKSNVSSNTYQDIEECIQHAELARCNSIASDSTVYREAHQMTLETDEQGILRVCPSDSPMIRNAQIPYQIEFRKKTGCHVKKYFGIFCMILVCAIISAATASVFSTKSLRENISSDVQNQLGYGEVHLQTLSNVTDDEVMTHIDDLRSEMEEYLDETNMKIELLLQTSLNKAGFKKLQNGTKEETRQYILQLVHDAQCKTNCIPGHDGDYQSCKSCIGYITCTNGQLIKRPCAPTGDQRPVYWDDFKKACIFESRTCYVPEENTTISSKV